MTPNLDDVAAVRADLVSGPVDLERIDCPAVWTLIPFRLSGPLRLRELAGILREQVQFLVIERRDFRRISERALSLLR